MPQLVWHAEQNSYLRKVTHHDASVLGSLVVQFFAWQGNSQSSLLSHRVKGTFAGILPLCRFLVSLVNAQDAVKDPSCQDIIQTPLFPLSQPITVITLTLKARCRLFVRSHHGRPAHKFNSRLRWRTTHPLLCLSSKALV